MNIYEIDTQISALIDQDTGEVSDIEALMALSMERERKVENLACAYKNLLADADAIKAEKNSLADREATCRKKAEKAKAYLELVLAGEKFSSARCNVSYRKSQMVNITDKQETGKWLAHEGYMGAVKMEKVYTPDKAEVKKLIQSGVYIPGATIEEKNNMQVK